MTKETRVGAHSSPEDRVQNFDGAMGGVFARTEPKVRAATIAAVLTPALMWVAAHYLPGYDTLPPELTGVLMPVITGLATWLSGWLAVAVNRVDIFGPLAPPVDPADAITIPAPPTVEIPVQAPAGAG